MGGTGAGGLVVRVRKNSFSEGVWVEELPHLLLDLLPCHSDANMLKGKKREAKEARQPLPPPFGLCHRLPGSLFRSGARSDVRDVKATVSSS